MLVCVHRCDANRCVSVEGCISIPIYVYVYPINVKRLYLINIDTKHSEIFCQEREKKF